MECTVYEGEDSDTIEFTRSGVKGELIVSADAFELQAKLGLLLGALRGTIEKEISQELDKLLAAKNHKATGYRTPSYSDTLSTSVPVLSVLGRVGALLFAPAQSEEFKHFAALEALVDLTAPLLRPGGFWLAMKGRDPQGEMMALPPQVAPPPLVMMLSRPLPLMTSSPERSVRMSSPSPPIRLSLPSPPSRRSSPRPPRRRARRAPAPRPHHCV